jgi:replicative superfamily II helicase
MLRRLGLEQKKTILFVCPFVALVEDKCEHLRNVWRDLELSVCAFHGEDGGNELTDDIDVAVCTIEKANVL